VNRLSLDAAVRDIVARVKAMDQHLAEQPDPGDNPPEGSDQPGGPSSDTQQKDGTQ
jgi:hypothetical protein